jgi:uncharacterized peroxidase-related enzyme
MAYINLGIDEQLLPGITGLLAYSPATARPLTDLANALLRAPNSLTPGEREMIAAYVSRLNRCTYCAESHGAFAAAQLDNGVAIIEGVTDELESAPISEKLRALLNLAGVVQRDPRQVTQGMVDQAVSKGASETEIHDTVLIAAAFCMFNRYVDGLGTQLPTNTESYEQQARRIMERGYSS